MQEIAMYFYLFLLQHCTYTSSHKYILSKTRKLNIFRLGRTYNSSSKGNQHLYVNYGNCFCHNLYTKTKTEDMYFPTRLFLKHIRELPFYQTLRAFLEQKGSYCALQSQCKLEFSKNPCRNYSQFWDL